MRTAESEVSMINYLGEIPVDPDLHHWGTENVQIRGY